LRREHDPFICVSGYEFAMEAWKRVASVGATTVNTNTTHGDVHVCVRERESVCVYNACMCVCMCACVCLYNHGNMCVRVATVGAISVHTNSSHGDMYVCVCLFVCLYV